MVTSSTISSFVSQKSNSISKLYEDKKPFPKIDRNCRINYRAQDLPNRTVNP